MSLRLRIFIDSGVHSSWTQNLDNILNGIFPFKEIRLSTQFNLPEYCWNNDRQQYDGNCLLSHIISNNPAIIVLLIISKDAYVPRLNFVFGVASHKRGAVVSIFRLGKDPDFLKKEIIHELGHVFGLNHCTLPCVMTFSNSVYEAQLKNCYFCGQCSKQLKITK
jgi:archaemetzincin